MSNWFLELKQAARAMNKVLDELGHMSEEINDTVDYSSLVSRSDFVSAQHDRNMAFKSMADNLGGLNKPTKATLILEREVNGDHWTAGDPTIEVDDHAALHTAIRNWRMENGIPPKFVRYVHYDGMLFEYTTKSILAEVGTGIEI